MNNDTTILDKILYHGLQPWLDKNSIDEKFTSKLTEIKEVQSEFQETYQIEFQRPFNSKTKYYSKLILNAATLNTNELLALIKDDDNLQLTKYWLNDTLNKKLKTRLKDIGKLIKERDFSLVYIDPKKSAFDKDQNHKSDTYIIQLLKLAYMKIYLEVQEAYRDLIEDILIIDDFYTQLLFEPIPDNALLKAIQTIEVVPVVTPKKELPKSQVTSTSSFRYKQIDTDPEKLTDLLDSLKLGGFVSQETTLLNFKKAFTGKQVSTPIVWTGNMSELYYFIKLIHKDHQLVDDLKQKQWEVTCACFVKKDGTQFDRSKFRSLKRPNTTGDNLDKAVQLIS
ncbi:MAG: hypothetical protein RIM99_08255 [Cyclobacteriaceae bacterium]